MITLISTAFGFAAQISLCSLRGQGPQGDQRCHTFREMCTEYIVVLSDGIGVLPWMLCGTSSIGEVNMEKMKEFRPVV